MPPRSRPVYYFIKRKKSETRTRRIHDEERIIYSYTRTHCTSRVGKRCNNRTEIENGRARQTAGRGRWHWFGPLPPLHGPFVVQRSKNEETRERRLRATITTVNYKTIVSGKFELRTGLNLSIQPFRKKKFRSHNRFRPSSGYFRREKCDT